MRPRREILLAAIVALGVSVRLWSAFEQDTLKDGYHTWWIAARLAATGEYGDPFAEQVGARWLPGYHFLAAGILQLAGPHALLALRLVNVALAGLAIALVARLGERLHPGAGLPAALLYALAPWEAITAARAMPESAAWLLALAGANALLAPPDARARWAWAGAAALALACLFRYEAWLLAALFAARAVALGAREALPRPHVAAAFAGPAAAAAIVWAFAATSGAGLFLPDDVLAQGRAEAAYHEAVGQYTSDAAARVVLFLAFILAGPIVIVLLALAGAIRGARAFPLAVVLTFLAAIAFLVGTSTSDGSPRYFGMAMPFLAIMAGAALVRARSRLGFRGATAAAALLLVVAGQAGATAWMMAQHTETAVYEAPALRAGQWLAANAPRAGSLLVSESPAAAFWSGHDPARTLGSRFLPDERAAALAELRAEGDIVVFVNDSIEKYPHYRLGALFPELREGRSTAEFDLAFDANGWEREYGAREVYVYRVRGSP